MAELLIRTPGEPDRRVPLSSRPITIGRHESCDVQILEVKASKRHFELAPDPRPGATAGRAFVLTDLQSSNGTFVEEARVQRRLVEPGDEIRVGTTRISIVEGASGEVATQAGLPTGLKLSGGLVLGAPPAPAAPPVEGREPAPIVITVASPARTDADSPAGPALEVRRAVVAGRKSIARGAAVLAAGIVAVVCVEAFVSKTADKRLKDHAEAEKYLEILKRRDEDFAKVESLFREFREDFPASARTPELEKLIDAKRALDARARADERALNDYVARLVPMTDAEVHGRLTELLERHGGEGDPLRSRLQKALADLGATHERAIAKARADARDDVARALATGDAGAAMRRLKGLLARFPELDAAARDSIGGELAEVTKAATQLADAALAKAESIADPDGRRRVLLDAIRGLDGTAEVDRVASVLRRVSGGALPGAGTPTASRPDPKDTGAAFGLLSADVLGRIADAERLARERRWFAAAKAYDALLAMDASARVKADWTQRRSDLARVIDLVDQLGKAVAGSKEAVLVVPVGDASWHLVSVDENGVRVRKGEAQVVVPFASMAPHDLLALLGHGVPTPDRRLALATLAADLGDRVTAVQHLVALVELPTHRDLAFAVMAHRVEGRTSIPEGGYRALDGDLLELSEWTTRTEARRLAALKVEAAELVKKASEDPALEKLHGLRQKREELDRRRAHALLAIFNEKHWPYPHNMPSIAATYAVVTAECEKRWKAVEELWDEPTKGGPGPTAALEKLVARHAEIMKELAEKEVDVEAMTAAMEPYAIYVGVGPMTLRTFFTSKEEKELLAYNRWVMEVYNPAHTYGAIETEIEQVRITNEYRMAMGFSFVVEPGPAALEAIDAGNVEKILDQAKETARRPLRALRIDERLWKAARAHSDDMSKRGFFAHEAPPNEATGEPGTNPPQRVQKQGYGGSCGENIATASNAMTAHLMWLHSSGHHRNILSPWEDMGMGFSGARATQDFGAGVAEAVIDDSAGPAPGPGKKKRKDPKEPKDPK